MTGDDLRFHVSPGAGTSRSSDDPDLGGSGAVHPRLTHTTPTVPDSVRPAVCRSALESIAPKSALTRTRQTVAALRGGFPREVEPSAIGTVCSCAAVRPLTYAGPTWTLGTEPFPSGSTAFGRGRSSSRDSNATKRGATLRSRVCSKPCSVAFPPALHLCSRSRSRAVHQPHDGWRSNSNRAPNFRAVIGEDFDRFLMARAELLLQPLRDLCDGRAPVEEWLVGQMDANGAGHDRGAPVYTAGAVRRARR